MVSFVHVIFCYGVLVLLLGPMTHGCCLFGNTRSINWWWLLLNFRLRVSLWRQWHFIVFKPFMILLFTSPASKSLTVLLVLLVLHIDAINWLLFDSTVLNIKLEVYCLATISVMAFLEVLRIPIFWYSLIRINEVELLSLNVPMQITDINS